MSINTLSTSRRRHLAFRGMGKIRIEVQDQQGRWHRYTECGDSPTVYRGYLKQAARSSLARNSGKARAVEADTGQVVDFEQV